jgi:hypothetical protein
MRQEDRRRERLEKRRLKREGTRRARRNLKRSLELNPDEAAFDEIDYGRASTEHLNGPPRMHEDSSGGDPPVPPRGAPPLGLPSETA